MSYQELFFADDISSDIEEAQVPVANSTLNTDASNDLKAIKAMLGRLTSEVVSLTTEVASIKAKVCGEAFKPKEVVPMEPLKTLEELTSFEERIKDEKVFKSFVIELQSSGEKTFDKFIRSSWRLMISDDVARQCSWRGTEAKKCVRGMKITLGIRTAFKQKFALEDADFDRTTQKYFQYAQDRLSRSAKKMKSSS
ncbi:hypothetical protein ACLKA6_008565 [Drosophila palustris]